MMTEEPPESTVRVSDEVREGVSERVSERVKVGHHFEQALQQSRQQSEKRVQSLKQKTMGVSDGASSSTTGGVNEEVSECVSERVRGRGSVAERWGSALQGSKAVQSAKIRAVRRTSSNIVAAGLVSSRVSALEQCVMQAHASSEQIEAMLKQLLSPSLARRPPKVSISSVHESNDSHTHIDSSDDCVSSGVSGERQQNSDVEATLPTLSVMCNDTSSYHFESNSKTYQLLDTLLVSISSEPVALRCGVFMSSDDALQESAQHEVVALAMRDPTTHEPYLAFTINLPTHTTTSTTTEKLRVAFFMPSSHSEHTDDESCPVWEAVFNLQTVESSRASSVVVAGGDGSVDVPQDDSVDNHTNENNIINVERTGVCEQDESFDDSETSFGRGRGEYVSDSDSAIDEGEGVWIDAGHKGDYTGDSSFYDTDMSSVSSSMPNTPSKGKEDNHHHSSKIFSLEGGLPEVRYNVGRSQSVQDIERQHFMKLEEKKQSHTLSTHTIPVTTNNIITMDTGPMSSDNYDHDLDQNQNGESNDDDTLKSGQYSTVDIVINAFDIILASSSNKMLIIKNRVDNSTTVISTDDSNSTDLQKAHVDASSNMAISNNTLVQWTRAVAMSGWLTKWPMQNQKAGFRTKRFFILRDRTLSYHKHEPRNQEEARSDYAMHSIQLKNTFTVGPSSSKITPCVKLDTGTDKLWFRCKSKRKEQQWINAIREGCQRYATPSPIPVHASQHKVTSIWHHENPRYVCKFIDVVDTVRGYGVVVAALFSCTHEKTRETTYSLQCTTKEFGVALEQLDLMEAQHSPQISCMRILDCNVLCLSGSSGYLGVAVLGEGSVGSVRTRACPVTCRQFEGHSRNSCVTCLAYCPQRELLVSGDIKGGLALWSHETRGNLAYLGKIKIQEGGDINSITFHPTKNAILVGTYSKLYMVGIWHHQADQQRIYRFEGITLLDECGLKSVCCFYSTVFNYVKDTSGSEQADLKRIDSKQAKDRLQVTIWKVETIQRHDYIEDTESDDVATYSTNGYDIESMLELEDDSEHQAKLSEVKLSSERDLTVLLEEEETKQVSKSKSEDEQESGFHSRVCRFAYGEECLYEAMENLVPIERSDGVSNAAEYDLQQSMIRTSDGSRSFTATKAYVSSRHYANEARSDMCAANNTGVNLILMNMDKKKKKKAFDL